MDKLVLDKIKNVIQTSYEDPKDLERVLASLNVLNNFNANIYENDFVKGILYESTKFILNDQSAVEQYLIQYGLSKDSSIEEIKNKRDELINRYIEETKETKQIHKHDRIVYEIKTMYYTFDYIINEINKKSSSTSLTKDEIKHNKTKALATYQSFVEELAKTTGKEITSISPVDNSSNYKYEKDNKNNPDWLEPVEFIEGTSVRKPRNKGIYETEAQYEAFLETYYKKNFEGDRPRFNHKFDTNFYDDKAIYVIGEFVKYIDGIKEALDDLREIYNIAVFNANHTTGKEGEFLQKFINEYQKKLSVVNEISYNISYEEELVGDKYMTLKLESVMDDNQLYNVDFEINDLETRKKYSTCVEGDYQYDPVSIDEVVDVIQDALENAINDGYVNEDAYELCSNNIELIIDGNSCIVPYKDLTAHLINLIQNKANYEEYSKQIEWPAQDELDYTIKEIELSHNLYLDDKQIDESISQVDTSEIEMPELNKENILPEEIQEQPEESNDLDYTDAILFGEPDINLTKNTEYQANEEEQNTEISIEPMKDIKETNQSDTITLDENNISLDDFLNKLSDSSEPQKENNINEELENTIENNYSKYVSINDGPMEISETKELRGSYRITGIKKIDKNSLQYKKAIIGGIGSFFGLLNTDKRASEPVSNYNSVLSSIDKKVIKYNLKKIAKNRHVKIYFDKDRIFMLEKDNEPLTRTKRLFIQEDLDKTFNFRRDPQLCPRVTVDDLQAAFATPKNIENDKDVHYDIEPSEELELNELNSLLFGEEQEIPKSSPQDFIMDYTQGDAKSNKIKNDRDLVEQLKILNPGIESLIKEDDSGYYINSSQPDTIILPDGFEYIGNTITNINSPYVEDEDDIIEIGVILDISRNYGK